MLNYKKVEEAYLAEVMIQLFDNNLVQTINKNISIIKNVIKCIFTSNFILYNCQSVTPVNPVKTS
jgi:hypothetical protein